MKIIQVISALKMGGGEIMLENLCYGLMKLGHEVIIVSLERFQSPITERLEKCNVKILYLDKKLGVDLSIPQKLYKVFMLENPDVVHMHIVRKIYVYPAAHRANVKKIFYTVHNMANNEQSFISSIYSSWLYKRQKVIPVGITPLVSKSICDKYSISNVETVYNGIQTEKYVSKIDYSLKKYPVILNVARFAPQKNHIRLLEAFRQVVKEYPTAKLQLIGEGVTKQAVEKKVTELGMNSNVEFLGLKDEVGSFMHEADIFCLSSDYEGMPMTLIEAMASGMPIVSTAVGGVPDLLKNGNNAILTSLDTDAIAVSIIRLLNNKRERLFFGKNALKDSVNFSNIKMAEDYLEIYSAAVE